MLEKVINVTEKTTRNSKQIISDYKQKEPIHTETSENVSVLHFYTCSAIS